MQAALVIAGKDLRQRFRDRSAIVLCFVAPLLIGALMSFAFSGAENLHLTVGVVDGDHGATAQAFVQTLRGPELHNVITVRLLGSKPAASTAVRSRTVETAIVIPAGFSAAAVTATPLPLEVLTSVNQPIAGQVARPVVADHLQRSGSGRRVSEPNR